MPYRIGFVSPDFRNHSVSRFMTPLMRNLPESEWEVTFYSDVKQKDSFTAELEAIGGNWGYAYSMTDVRLAERIREDGIDILVDLAGHTGHNRLLVFARHPAPIQVSWLGYPQTTGLECMDYRISDAIADPPGRADEWSSETLLRLDGGFHCFEPPVELPPISELPLSRNGYVTFGSFNNQAKINPMTVQRWAVLLSRFPGSRLLLKNQQLSDSRAVEIWRQQFQRYGVAPDQVIYEGFRSSLQDHYRLYERIDIALDTFPYNGTTTTCEALWMGVPVLTMLGDHQRGRTAASLLTHASLADWIAEDETQWLTIAERWVGDPEALNSLRSGLREQMESSPIGDGPGFARRFYGLLRTLIDSHRS